MHIHKKSVLFLSFILLAQVTFAQTLMNTSRNTYQSRLTGSNQKKYDEVYDKLYKNFIKNKSEDKPIGIPVKSNNPAYKNVYLYPEALHTVSVNPDYVFDNRKLHMALVEYAPNAQNKKAEILLFFVKHDPKASKNSPKDIIKYLDNNPIIMTEMYEDIFIEEYLWNYGKNTKLYGTTTYIYDIDQIHPDKKPILIGKMFQYKPDLQSPNYNNSSLINYNANGKMVSAVHRSSKIQTKTAIIEYVQYFDENEKLKEISFDYVKYIQDGVAKTETLIEYETYKQQKLITLGMDFAQNKPIFNYYFRVPYDMGNKWNYNYLNYFDVNRNVLADLKQSVAIEPDIHHEQLKEFLTNYHKLPEYIINDEKKQYIYQGTYNNEGLPDGWGFIYEATNPYNEECYLGQFKNGLPDGLGIRQNFKLDKPESEYSSSGYHVGNTLVYGSRTTWQGSGYTTAYGDYRNVLLNGDGIKLRARLIDDAYPELHVGNFEQGGLHGVGAYYSHDTRQQGDFINGDFIAGKSVIDKSDDSRYKVGAVITYMGQKRVIMKKDKGNFYLDNGQIIAATSDVGLTGEYSLRKTVCNICGGTGYLQPTTNTIFSGTTKKTKTYETGPTGYILWEKTTTTSTAPITVTKTNRCSCLNGTSGSEPVPLK